MTSISTDHSRRSFLDATAELKNNALLRVARRTLLGGVEKALAESNMHDDTTKLIRLWHKGFSVSLSKDCNVPKAVSEFIVKLQSILIDPIPRITDAHSTATLDEPLLGSDGIVYSAKSLTVFLSADGINPKRSPFRQNDPTPFTTNPHPLAAYLVAWLKEKQGHFIDAETEETYKKLMTEGKAAAIPSSVQQSQQERVRRIAACQAGSKRQKQVEQKERKEGWEERRAALRARLFPNGDSQRDRIQTMTDNLKQGLFSLKISDEDGIRRVEQQIEALKERVEGLNRFHREIEQQIKEIREKINEANRQNSELQIAILEVQKAIVDREKSWLSELVITVAIITASIAATYAIMLAIKAIATAGATTASAAAASSASVPVSATVVPTSSGALLHVKITSIPKALKIASVLTAS